jgi:hypothetical protein
VLGATGALAAGLSTRDCLVLVEEAVFQARKARPRLVYAPTAVQLFTPACFACLRTRYAARFAFFLSFFVTDWPLRKAVCSLQFTLLLAPNTGRRCTQGTPGCKSPGCSQI